MLITTTTNNNTQMTMHGDVKVVVVFVTIFLDYFYFLHALTSCYMRLPYVVYFYFDHALTMF